MSLDPLERRLEDWASDRTAPTPTAAESRRFAAVVAGRAKERARGRRRLGMVAAAAAVLVIACGTWAGLHLARTSSTWTPDVVYLEGTAVDPTGDTLAVPGEGRLVARLGDDVVGLAEATTVHIERARPDATRLQLEEGTLVAEVQPRGPRGGRFEIASGAHLVTVVGTRFLVERPAGGGLRVVVRDGVVKVEGPSGEQRIEAGYRLHVEADGAWELEPIEPSIERLTMLLSTVPAPPPESPVPRPRRGDDDGAEVPPEPPVAPLRGETAPPPEDLAPTLDELRRRLLDGELEQTAGELEARLAETPSDADAWALLAVARRKSGDTPGAVSAWREVVAHGDEADANRARYEAALLLQGLPGGHAEAIALLEDLLASPAGVESLGGDVRLHLAESLLTEGRESEARPVLEEVAEDYPGTGPAMAARELLGTLE